MSTHRADRHLKTAARALAAARHVLVLTGAGVSAESGIPTFRDALTGLWSNFDAEELATQEGYLRDPPLVWGWYQWRRNKVLATQPNPGHFAIAALARKVPRLTLVTQNVDDLHERAGSRDVRHLHGSILTARCLDCARPHPLPPGPTRMTHDGMRLDPPRCAHCGGLVRPDVVWFGELLPRGPLAEAEAAAAECDVVVSVGTSSLVYPAAELAPAAARRGATVIQVNPNVTALDDLATVNLAGPSGAILPRLLAAMA